MSMLTENRMRSTSIERFRENQSRRKGHPFATIKMNEGVEENEVSWKQILITFGGLFAAGMFFTFIVFFLAFLSILF